MSEKYDPLTEGDIDSIVEEIFKIKFPGHHENNQPGYKGFPTYVLKLNDKSDKSLNVVCISSIKDGPYGSERRYSKAAIITDDLQIIFEKAPLIFETDEIKRMLEKGINKRSDGKFEKRIADLSESTLKEAIEDILMFTWLVEGAYASKIRHEIPYVNDAKFSYEVAKGLHN